MEEVDRCLTIERKKVAKEFAKNKEDLERQNALKDTKELEQKKIEEEKRKAEIRAKKALKLLALRNLALEIAQMPDDEKEIEVERIKIPESVLFEKVGDHLEIRKEFLDILSFIDISNIPFENVKLEGINFKGCNPVILNPQLVYKKSLKGSDFTGVYLSSVQKYTGVDITGCKFGEDKKELTLDTAYKMLEDAIYDDTTTWNGKPLKDVLSSKHK